MSKKKVIKKSLLEKVRVNETLISRFLGLLVVITIGALLLNYFKSLEKGEITPESESTQVQVGDITYREENGELIPQDLPEKHVVLNGENLWTIAENYYGSGYNWVDLAEANNLSDPDLLIAGQELVLTNVPVRFPVITATSTKSPIEGTEYTVEKGDSLWKIAVRAYGNGYRWNEIASANKLVNPDTIHSGNRLSLPR